MANEKNKKPAKETVEAPATATAESTAPTGQQAPQPDPTALSIGDLLISLLDTAKISL